MKTGTGAGAWFVFWLRWAALALRFYRRPPLHLNPEHIQQFEALYAAILAGEPGTILDYRCAAPKYAFLCYLVEHQPVLVHGSNNHTISVFEPRDQTDFFGATVRAVFATADGIWPMYFALVDRRDYPGSLRNGCFSLTDPRGRAHTFYFFSVNADALKAGAWMDGMLYLLPRDTFQRVPGAPDEWMSEQPVPALARLPISPEDFPFLHQVVGHREEESMLVSRTRMTLAKWCSLVFKPARASRNAR